MRKRVYAYLSLGFIAVIVLWVWRRPWGPPLPAATPAPTPTVRLVEQPFPAARQAREPAPTTPPPPTMVPQPSARPAATATATPTPAAAPAETICLEIDCDCARLKGHDLLAQKPAATGQQDSAGSVIPARPADIPRPTPSSLSPPLAEATNQPLAQAAAAPATPPPVPPAAATAAERLILANYFPWFDGDGWDDCNLCDRPQQPYDSDDPAAMRRHVQQALDAGLDGFTSQWLAVGDRTDRNFAQLLEQSRGTPFRSTIVFSRHMLPDGPSQDDLVAALHHVMATYAGHPNFLHSQGRPVIFFTDVYRLPVAAGQSPQEGWDAIRRQVDPDQTALWIAEGLDPSYLAVFDGLYVHKITHAAYPDDYAKAPRWAGQVRAWAQRSGQPKLWVATISPGWDDTRAGCRADVRLPSQPHHRDREEGAFYRATFASALASQPDWLWVNSFNEWVECTHIEPSAAYGDLYLQLTRQFVQQFKPAQ